MRAIQRCCEIVFCAAMLLVVYSHAGLASAAAHNFQQVAPLFLKSYCIDCHGADTQEADLRLDQLGKRLGAKPEPIELWSTVDLQLLTMQMPPA